VVLFKVVAKRCPDTVAGATDSAIAGVAPDWRSAVMADSGAVLDSGGCRIGDYSTTDIYLAVDMCDRSGLNRETAVCCGIMTVLTGDSALGKVLGVRTGQ